MISTRVLRRLFLAALVALTLSSCDDSRGRIEEDVVWDVIPIRVAYDDWESTDDGYMVRVDVPQLTSFVCTDGMVQCYLQYPDQDKSQTVLPSVRYCSYEVEDPETGLIEVFLYQRLIDYEFIPGRLYLYYTVSDFDYSEDYPGEMNFRLVIQQ